MEATTTTVAVKFFVGKKRSAQKLVHVIPENRQHPLLELP